MRHNQLLTTIITAAAGLFANTAAGLAQCVNMTDLDDPGTTCYVYNHEFKYRDSRVENYDWVEYSNVIEDYGLSNTNNYSYNVPNVQCTRHTIVTEQGPDYLQSALKMIPEGRSTSIRIGNPRNGGKGTYTKQPSEFMKWHPQGEAIAMDYKVTAENAILLFEYAAILDRTHHTNDDTDNEFQAFIDVEITNRYGVKLNPSSLAFTCRGNRSVAQDADQGWKSFTHGGIQSSWKDWSTVGFDLTQYIGQTVRLRVANFDCAVSESNQSYYNMYFYYCGKHFSYIYFYVDCAPKKIETECLENSQARLTAPEGFLYKWYNKAKPSTTLGTSRSIEVPADGKTTYCCQVTQKERMKGSFIMETTPLCGKEVNITATVCEKELPYLFGGKKLTESGNYSHTVQLTPGIDSVTNLELTVQRVKDMPVQTAYICTGSTYNWKVGKKTRPLSKGGTYRDTLRYKSGCDSIRYTLILDEHEKIETEDHQQVCAATLTGGGYGFSWNGKWINKASFDGLTYTTSSELSGCDSIVTLRLDILDDLEYYDTVRVTESEIRKGFMWHDYSIYYDDTNFKSFKEAETFFNNYFTEKSSSKGCKEYTNLRLYIVQEITEELSICETELPAIWRGYTIESAADNGKVVNDNDNRVRYTLDLKIHPTYNETVNMTVCDGEEVTLGDTLLTSTGVYKRKLQSQYGCDSTVTLNLKVQTAKTVRTERVSICKGDPAFNWEGHGAKFQNLTEDGLYRDTAYYRATGCDSAYYALRITTGDSTIAHMDKRICYGDSVNFFGEWKRVSGVYRGVTENTMQCDSIVYMHLNVLPPLQTVTTDTVICDAQPLNWRGQTIKGNGQYEDTLKSTLQCDSVAYILNVKFLTSSSVVIDTTLCYGEEITLGDTVLTTAGNYERTLTNAAGCDSIVTMKLHYLPEPQTINAFICEGQSYTFHGKEYSKSDQYLYVVGETSHCKAIDTLNLTVGSVISGDEYVTLCDGNTYRFQDTILATTGDYEKLIIRTGTGLCDSLARIHLTVLPAAKLIEAKDTIYQGDTLHWRDTTITTGGEFKQIILNQLGCDSIVYSLDATFRGVTTMVIDTVIEPGETYLLRDSLIETPGTYYDTLYYTNGRDSVYVVIHLEVIQQEVKGRFHIDTVCGNDQALTAVFVREQGRPVKYDLLFTEAAKNQGFEDKIDQPMKDTSEIHISVKMPKKEDNEQWYVRPEKYGATLNVTDKQDRKTSYEATFTVLYPSWVILQRWNDVLTITNRDFNGGYDFTHVQWYIDDEKADGRGEGNFYYYAGDGEQLQFGVPYRAELTRADDGKTFSTCEYVPSYQEEKVIFKEQLNVAPRYAGNTREIEVKTNMSGRYVVYDISGKQVMSGWFGPAYGDKYIVFPASFPNGTYIIRFMPDEKKEIHKKWLVY
ncbi:MAG: hypothetical protein K5660_04590 [Paludibacteraceae bacterium]|nr:hypothetical protein [Paludibacteraceae bacterium]